MEMIVLSILLSFGVSEGYEALTACQSPATVQEQLADGRMATVPVCLDDLQDGGEA